MTDIFNDLEDEFLGGGIDHHNGQSGTGVSVTDEERKRRREVMANRSGAALKKKWADEDRGSLDALITPPPVISEPKCQTCQSAHRTWIERQLVKGTAYVVIARSLPGTTDDNEDNVRRSISSHYKRHMALESAVVRAIMEEEAGLLGQNIEEGVRGAFTNRGALDILIRKAYEDALNGVTTVEPKDLIQMMKLHGDMSAEDSGTAVEEAKTSVRIFMAAIQNVLLKGDRLNDRQLGTALMQDIVTEVGLLKQEEGIGGAMERQLLPRRVD
jgi:hypothetical protein